MPLRQIGDLRAARRMRHSHEKDSAYGRRASGERPPHVLRPDAGVRCEVVQHRLVCDHEVEDAREKRGLGSRLAQVLELQPVSRRKRLNRTVSDATKTGPRSPRSTHGLRSRVPCLSLFLTMAMPRTMDERISTFVKSNCGTFANRHRNGCCPIPPRSLRQ